MKYNFSSVWATQMNDYLIFLCNAGRYIDKIKSSLKSLDRYLEENRYQDKFLTQDVIYSWVSTKQVKSRTKAGCIANIKGFVNYLVSLGFHAEIPESPIVGIDYVPYIFSQDQLKRMMSVADNFEGSKKCTRSTIVFPVLFRLLYGCGLRLGEGLTLKWEDIDLRQGIITVVNGKNLKQRIVPMSKSLTELLKSYKDKVQHEKICSIYLFESNFAPGKSFKNNTFYMWFSNILKKSDIHYAKQRRSERGPCPHCLRHTFVLHSFLKSENEGRKFEDTAAFLSAYLGHDSTKETDNYLRANHSVYTQSHKRVNDYIGHLIPEVNFYEN